MKHLCMIAILAAATLGTSNTSLAQNPTETRDAKKYKFWIKESGDQFCILGGKFFIENLYNNLSRRRFPAFEYHIDGKPQGPAFIVDVEGISLSPEKCYWRIESMVVAYDKPGWQAEDRLTVYQNLGAVRSFGNSRENDVIEKIQMQLDYFVHLQSVREPF